MGNSELHWHKNAEWAYVLKGYTQISAVDQNGKNIVATVGPGDLWYFPAGVPHSLQATDQDPDGSEFLLVSLYSKPVYNASDHFPGHGRR